MRFHLLAVPNAPTTKAFGLDGFSQRTILFAEVLTHLGHTVYLYASEQNEAPCDTHIVCITKAAQEKLIGQIPYQCVDFRGDSDLFRSFNAMAAATISQFKRSEDVLCTIGGTAQALVSTQHPELRCLEYSIGYQGVFAPFRVYQSHIWRHCASGYTGNDGGREFDGVIPPWFHESEFPFVQRPERYVAYCGRIVARKGVQTACKAAEAAGVPLVLVGFGDTSLITYGEHKGALLHEARNAVLANASAVFMPTQYLEPFGNVSAEAQLCGTPIISTDYGAFVESVEQGKTGYRCASLGEFVEAIKLAPSLDRRYIRERAVRLYGFDAGVEQYRKYFRRLELLRGAGWDSLDPGLTTPVLTDERMPDAEPAYA